MCIDRLCGMFEGKLSTDDYAAQKQLDKELEGLEKEGWITK